MNTIRGLRESWIARVGCSAMVAASALALSAAPASAREVRLPLVVGAENFRFQGVPKKLTAGAYRMQLINGSEDAHVFVAVNLGPTCSASVTTVGQAKNFLNRVDGEEKFLRECPGGSLAADVFAKPRTVGRGPLKVTPGRLLYFCPISEEDGTPHSDLGMIGFIKVSGPPAG